MSTADWMPEQLAELANRFADTDQTTISLTQRERDLTAACLRVMAADLWKAQLKEQQTCHSSSSSSAHSKA